MANNLLSTSLEQGNQFKLSQIKNKTPFRNYLKNGFNSSKIQEGFVSSREERIVRPEYLGYQPIIQTVPEEKAKLTQINSQELKELDTLKTKYSKLLSKYEKLTNKMESATSSAINRISSNNPYLGKNIKLKQGPRFYVTSDGVAKKYPNNDTFKATKGKNGCPSDKPQHIDVLWNSKYIEGSTIPTNPGLLVGSDMISGQSCGNEGSNVYASHVIDGGSKHSLGKVAYIGPNAELMEYPKSMIGYSNNYQIFQNTNSKKNDIKSLPAADQMDCQNACNDNSKCAAYVYQGSSQTCWLKNSSAYPKGKKQSDQNMILGVREPKIISNSGCNSKIVNINTSDYDSYVKGKSMKNNSKCIFDEVTTKNNDSILSDKDKLKIDNIRTQLNIIGNEIIEKLEILDNENKLLNNNLSTNNASYREDIEKYRELNYKINYEINLKEPNIEGMQNANIKDMDAMLSDANIRVNKENYEYIFWTILAIGIIPITIKLMKR